MCKTRGNKVIWNMTFVAHEHTGSKVLRDPELCEECLLHDQTYWQSISAISKTRNSGTPEHQNTRTVKFRNTGTAKVLNLVQILKSFAGGGFILRMIILSQVDRRTRTRHGN